MMCSLILSSFNWWMRTFDLVDPHFWSSLTLGWSRYLGANPSWGFVTGNNALPKTNGLRQPVHKDITFFHPQVAPPLLSRSSRECHWCPYSLSSSAHSTSSPTYLFAPSIQQPAQLSSGLALICLPLELTRFWQLLSPKSQMQSLE